MTRTRFIAGNWKMNTTLEEARALASALVAGAPSDGTVELAVFPPFPWLLPVRDALGDAPIRVGAQNCYIKDSGAFTGEVSPKMLSEVCDLVLAGHSERRHVFGESDELVGQKMDAIIASDLRAILCVGETLEERQAGNARRVITRQLDAGLRNITAAQTGSVTIAYEPVWAIGTGVAATPDDIQEMCATILSWLDSRYSGASDGMRILYGGSVTPENAASLFSKPEVDGALVGGASLKVEAFLAIIQAAHGAHSV